MNKYMSASWKERREKQRKEAEKNRKYDSNIAFLKTNPTLFFIVDGETSVVQIHFDDTTYLTCDEKLSDLWKKNLFREEGKYVLNLGRISPREIKSYIDNGTHVKGGILNFYFEQEGGKRNNRTKKKFHKKRRGSLRKK
jgi:hypothetical protein